MVAVFLSLLFVAALAVAVGVIVAVITPQMERIREVLAGTRHEIVAPAPIILPRHRRRVARVRLSPGLAALRAAA